MATILDDFKRNVDKGLSMPTSRDVLSSATATICICTPATGLSHLLGNIPEEAIRGPLWITNNRRDGSLALSSKPNPMF